LTNHAAKFGLIVYVCSTECQLTVHKEPPIVIKQHCTVSGTDSTNIKIGFGCVSLNTPLKRSETIMEWKLRLSLSSALL